VCTDTLTVFSAPRILLLLSALMFLIESNRTFEDKPADENENGKL
jgi:hypothetical protein